MNWLFWTLLIVGLILVVWPFFTVVSAGAATFLWILGGLLILGAIVWAAAYWSNPANANRVGMSYGTAGAAPGGYPGATFEGPGEPGPRSREDEDTMDYREDQDFGSDERGGGYPGPSDYRPRRR